MKKSQSQSPTRVKKQPTKVLQINQIKPSDPGTLSPSAENSSDYDSDENDPFACKNHKEKMVSQHCATQCIKRSKFYLELTGTQINYIEKFMDLYREFKLDHSVFQEKHFLLTIDKVKKDGEPPKREDSESI